MDVLLRQVNGTLHSLDILMRPIQILRLALDLFQLVDHLLASIDALIDHMLELLNQFLDTLLHTLHGFLVSALCQLRLNLHLLFGELCKLLILDLNLAHKAFDQTVLDLLFCRLLHRHHLSLHHIDSVLPLLDRLSARLLHSLGSAQCIGCVNAQ